MRQPVCKLAVTLDDITFAAVTQLMSVLLDEAKHVQVVRNMVADRDVTTQLLDQECMVTVGNAVEEAHMAIDGMLHTFAITHSSMPELELVNDIFPVPTYHNPCTIQADILENVRVCRPAMGRVLHKCSVHIAEYAYNELVRRQPEFAQLDHSWILEARHIKSLGGTRGGKALLEHVLCFAS